FLSAWMKKRPPVGIAQPGQLSQIASGGIADKKFHLGRLYQPLCQQVVVLLDFLVGCRARSPENNLASVGRKERAAVIAQFVSDLPYIRPVYIHRIKLEVTAACGSKHDFIPFGRNRSFGIIPGLIGKLS